MPQATNYASGGREDECGLKFWVDYIDNLGAAREERIWNREMKSTYIDSIYIYPVGSSDVEGSCLLFLFFFFFSL